jgi:hypothetical protein
MRLRYRLRHLGRCAFLRATSGFQRGIEVETHMQPESRNRRIFPADEIDLRTAANRIRAAWVLLAVVCFASSATAGYISISISPEAEFKDGKLRVDLRVLNSGDEAAYFLTPMLRFQGEGL